MFFVWKKRNVGWHGTGSTGPVEIHVRVRGGYIPDTIHAEAGVPTRVVFRREESSACSEQVVFPAFGKSAMLPEGRDVGVDLPPANPGTYQFTCAMGMLRGKLVIAPERGRAEPATAAELPTRDDERP